MPGRAAAVILLLLGAPAFPQCNFTPVRSAQFRSSALDVAVDGNDVWVATSYGLSLYDRQVDPPRLINSVAVPGTTRIVRAQNGIAYAGSGSSLAVIQKSGSRTLQIVRTIDAGGTINDIAATPLNLFVATSSGIVHFSLTAPSNPARSAAIFATSRPVASSLALIGSTLYAADGDASIEVFDVGAPSNPQLIGALSAPSAINLVRAVNGKLYASAGTLSTFLFTGSGAAMSLSGTAAFGTASLTPISGDVFFAAGNDRRLRAVDWSAPTAPVEIFRDDVPATAGTVNRITAMASTADRLYVAAGDIGLLTYDRSLFSAPFAMRAYATGGSNSVVSSGDKVYVGRESGGVAEFAQSSSGNLTQTRSWDTSRNDKVWDSGTNLLLTSTGSTATLWGLASVTPQTVTTVTFRSPVASAVLIGTTGYVVLSDGSFWSADFAQATPAPVQIVIAGVTPSAIARSGSSIVLSTVRDDGNTSLAFFSAPPFTQPSRTITVPGVSVTRVTLSGSTAAVLTFQGITIADFNTGATQVLLQSVGLARSLVLNGTTLYQLTDTMLVVWDLGSHTIAKQYTIPADSVSIDVAPGSSIADIATATGVASVTTAATSKVPTAIAAPNGNAYYKKIVSATDRIALFDGRNVDIYNDTLRYIGSVRGVADVAADDHGLYTVSNSLVVTSYTPAGTARGSFTINEGADAQPLGIRTAGGAAWVSIIRGCSAFSCEKKTLVFDVRSGVTQTATMTGGVTDLVTSGGRAYVLTDLPAEVRVMNIADPFHPAPIVTAAAPASPMSIAYANATVYVLGDKLTAYAESTLAPTGEILGNYVSDPTGTITAADQRVRIDGSCAVVTGRAFAPQLFTITSPTSWVAASSFPMPSPTRSISTSPGVLQFLTDHSLETWSTTAAPRPPRRETAR